MIYNVGDTAVLSSTWKVLNPVTGLRTLTTPTSTSVLVTPPTSTPYTIPNGSVVVDADGKLHVLVPITELGKWTARWAGTGAAAGVRTQILVARADV